MPRIRIQNQTNSGNRIGWTKKVTSVDPQGTNGYAFDGDFLPEGTLIDIPLGTMLLRVDPEGSVKSGWKSGHIFKVLESGELEELTPKDKDLDWYKDFLTIRDLAINALGEKINPFNNFTDEEIITEAKRRKLI